MKYDYMLEIEKLTLKDIEDIKKFKKSIDKKK